MGLNQTEFGRIANTTLDSQSRYEIGRHIPNAEYLARLASAGVDVRFVLTGERSAGDRLDDDAAELLSTFLSLPPHLRQVARSVLATMRDEAHGAPAPRTLHSRQSSYAAQVSPAADLPSEAALGEVFEALIAASPRLQGAELAHELARRLPTLLEVAARPVMDPGPAGYEAHEGQAEDPASDRSESRRARRT